jgi:hypothetical protein
MRVSGLVLCLTVLSVAACNIEERKERRRMRGPAMRILATAIEQYHVDYGVYPAPRQMREFARTDAERKKLKAAKGWYVGAIDHRKLLQSDEDTTVVPSRTVRAGLRFPLTDEYAPFKGLPLAYYSDSGGWILWSCGPDRIYDIDGSVVYDSSTTQPAEILIRKSYDVTNGTVSSGDIWRIKD